MSINEDHQILKYQPLDPFMLQYQPFIWCLLRLECTNMLMGLKADISAFGEPNWDSNLDSHWPHE